MCCLQSKQFSFTRPLLAIRYQRAWIIRDVFVSVNQQITATGMLTSFNFVSDERRSMLVCALPMLIVILKLHSMEESERRRELLNSYDTCCFSRETAETGVHTYICVNDIYLTAREVENEHEQKNNGSCRADSFT